MNLVAASRRSADIYIAHEDRFVVLDTPAGLGVCDPKDYKYQSTRPFQDDNSHGYIDSNSVIFATSTLLMLALRNYKYAYWGNRERRGISNKR